MLTVSANQKAAENKLTIIQYISLAVIIQLKACKRIAIKMIFCHYQLPSQQRRFCKHLQQS